MAVVARRWRGVPAERKGESKIETGCKKKKKKKKKKRKKEKRKKEKKKKRKKEMRKRKEMRELGKYKHITIRYTGCM